MPAVSWRIVVSAAVPKRSSAARVRSTPVRRDACRTASIPAGGRRALARSARRPMRIRIGDHSFVRIHDRPVVRARDVERTFPRARAARRVDVGGVANAGRDLPAESAAHEVLSANHARREADGRGADRAAEPFSGVRDELHALDERLHSTDVAPVVAADVTSTLRDVYGCRLSAVRGPCCDRRAVDERRRAPVAAALTGTGRITRSSACCST